MRALSWSVGAAVAVGSAAVAVEPLATAQLAEHLAEPSPSASAGTLTGTYEKDLITLYAVSFSGPLFFWLPASTELLAAAVGRQNPSASPSLVGFMCAAGQCTLFALLFVFGERIASRWQWLRRRVDAVAAHRRRFLDRGKLAMTIGAAVGGVPPTVPLFTLAPSFQMRLTPMLLIVFAFRYVRFASCCFLGSLQWGPGSPGQPNASSTAPWTAAMYTAMIHRGDGSQRWKPATRELAALNNVSRLLHNASEYSVLSAS